MKKLLILALTAVASLGLTFGTALAFSADETYISDLDDLKGATIVFKDTLSTTYFDITLDYSSNDNDFERLYVFEGSTTTLCFDRDNVVNNDTEVDAYDLEENQWLNNNYKTIVVSEDTTITINDGTEQSIVLWFNSNIATFTPSATPAETPTMWQAILSGIGGFFAGMFSVLSGLFSGVVAVFYTNNTTTILLQAIIFTAAASLVAVAVYVIVRLIKSAIARLRGGVGAAKGGKKVIEYSISNGKGGYRDVSRKEYRRFRRRK